MSKKQSPKIKDLENGKHFLFYRKDTAIAVDAAYIPFLEKTLEVFGEASDIEIFSDVETVAQNTPSSGDKG